MDNSEELDYLKRCYEEKSEQCYELEKKYLMMKRQKELAENYSDRLLLFIKSLQLPMNVTIPSWR